MLGQLPVLGLSLAITTASAIWVQAMELQNLLDATHIHGLAFDRADAAQIVIATHHGLFHASPDGAVSPLSGTQDDFMGFTPHPTERDLLYASGHPRGGGNLGFIASEDGGRTWVQRSRGVNGPVDFHQLTISPADPNVFYGSFGAIQQSTDGGRSWAVTGKTPVELIDLAASASNANTVLAATGSGLFISRDMGGSWEALIEGAPVTSIEVAGGSVYAFAVGRGFLLAPEGSSDFKQLSRDPFNDAFLVHHAIDPANPERMIAATNDGRILLSSDGGITWRAFMQNPDTDEDKP